jgi:hypothetical protein
MRALVLAFCVAACGPTPRDTTIRAANVGGDAAEVAGVAITAACSAAYSAARDKAALDDAHTKCTAAVAAYDVASAALEAFRKLEQAGASEAELVAAGARVAEAGKALADAARKAGAK